MTGSCSTAVGSGTRLGRAALKGTSWAVESCSRVTSVLTVQVSMFMFVSVFVRAPSRVHPLTLCLLSDDVDDWDFDGVAKPFEVHNDLYANNEDEDEDEGEDLEGRKVMVRKSKE